MSASPVSGPRTRTTTSRCESPSTQIIPHYLPRSGLLPLVQCRVLESQCVDRPEGKLPMPRPFRPARDATERAADEQRAQVLQRQLADQVSGVAITFVDHSGAGRIKAVPLDGLARAARSGVGFSPVIDAFGSDGGIDTASPLDVPDGDLRLVPDLDRLVVLHDPDGWAW